MMNRLQLNIEQTFMVTTGWILMTFIIPLHFLSCHHKVDILDILGVISWQHLDGNATMTWNLVWIYNKYSAPSLCQIFNLSYTLAYDKTNEIPTDL